MILVNNNKNQTIIIVTAPHCAICKAMNEANTCNNLPVNKLLVFLNTNISDRLTNEMMYKAKDPHSFFKELLLNDNIKYDDIDLCKDVAETIKDNEEFLVVLNKVKEIDGIPEFYLRNEDTGVIEYLDVRTHSLENNMLLGNSLVTILKNKIEE